MALVVAFLCAVVGALAVRAQEPADDRCGDAVSAREEAQVNLVDTLRDEKKVGVLWDLVSEVQGFAGELQAVFARHGNRNLKAEWARPVAQEVVRQFRLHPKNWWTLHPEHLILCLGYETGWSLDPKSTGAAGERSVFQFIPSTARMGGYNWTRMGGTSAEDIRYQIACGFDWAAHENTDQWVYSQWTGARLARKEVGS